MDAEFIVVDDIAGDDHADLRMFGRLLWAAELDRSTTAQNVAEALAGTNPARYVMAGPDDGVWIQDFAAELDYAATVILYDEGGMPTAVLEVDPS